MSSGEEPLGLMFNRNLRVAGEVIEGTVLLDFKTLQKCKLDEVHVKLRGSILTKITRQVGQSTQQRRQRVKLIHENISLWRPGTAYPAPETHIVQFPFKFTLPKQLPPSASYSGFRKQGNISYFVEVVGQRSGLHLDKRIVAPFVVISPDAVGAQLRDQFTAGWTGGWKTIEQEKKIRKGLWGEHSVVKATLSMPDIDIVPIFTSIPFTLNVTTTSKTMERDEATTSAPIFPPVPVVPKDVELTIERSIYIRAHTWSTSSTNYVAHLGGLGSGLHPAAYAPVEVEPMEKVWIPNRSTDEKKQKGFWKQEVIFKSSFALNCSPAFDADTMGQKFSLHLEVPFPGIGNNLKVEIPVNVVSSMHPPGTHAWDGPPPSLDLPPEYFSATNYDASDEKD